MVADNGVVHAIDRVMTPEPIQRRRKIHHDVEPDAEVSIRSVVLDHFLWQFLIEPKIRGSEQ